MEYIKLPKLTNQTTISNPNEISDDVRYLKIASCFWDKGYTGKNVKIGIIDTGIESQHSDLKNQIDYYKDFTGTGLQDTVGHGTAVASLISAELSSTGIVGIAPHSRLYIAKALTERGGNYDHLVSALSELVSMNLDIINMSLGGTYNDTRIEQLIKKATENGTIVVCAAGNSGDGINDNNLKEISYPAYYKNTLSIGSVNYRNLKPSTFSCANNQVDMLCLGEKVVVCLPNNKYGHMSGTSFASPLVAGFIAVLIEKILKEHGKKLSVDEMKSYLLRYCVDLGYPKNVQGEGMLYPPTQDIMSNLIENQKLVNNILLKQLQQ